MMAGVLMVSPSGMGMVGRLGMVSSLVGLRRLPMMTTCMLMMLGSLLMVLGSFFRHLMTPLVIVAT